MVTNGDEEILNLCGLSVMIIKIEIIWRKEK